MKIAPERYSNLLVFWAQAADRAVRMDRLAGSGKRVRVARVLVSLGRIPLQRGVLSAARLRGFSSRVRYGWESCDSVVPVRYRLGGGLGLFAAVGHRVCLVGVWRDGTGRAVDG